MTATWTDTVSVLLSLQPFEPFDESLAHHLLQSMHAVLIQLLDGIERGCFQSRISLKFLQDLRPSWPAEAGQDDHELLRSTFGVGQEPMDGDGEFSPSQVFAAYPYGVGELADRVIPHLASMGLPPVHDILAMICDPAWITVAEDQVVAYVA